MIDVPYHFQPEIKTIYPFENTVIFEHWLSMQKIPQTEREYLPINWTSYFVNNNYGNDKQRLKDLQDYIDTLPKDKKYWSVVQYDDGILVDVSKLDLLQFSMSNNIGVPIPLLCMPHSYIGGYEKTLLASFIGTHTHPIRENIFNIKENSFYISDKPHDVISFCQILDKSIFNLSPRGYGKNSFRLWEGMQYGCIPVYISDEFIIPYGIDFNEYGVLIEEKNASNIVDILYSITPQEIVKKQDRIKELYESYFTYNGLYKYILNYVNTADNT